MKKIFLLFCIAFIFSFNATAQLMDGKKSFSRKDSLRGTLYKERSSYDVTHYLLDIELDIDKRYIEGTNTITFKCLNDFQKLQFDLFENMKVEKVVWNKKNLKFSREHNAVFIDFPSTLKSNSTEKIVIHYSGNPQVAKRAPWDGGFVFKKDKNGKDWVGVACQGTGASLWWPNKDHQSDEPDSMKIIVACKSGLEEVSNGRLISKKKLKNGLTSWEWNVNSPINNYDVSINIGDYIHWSDTYASKINNEILTLDYYVLRNNELKARKQFEQVKPMLDAFEKRFSPYPFYKDGFKLVETPYLGMEHQSCVAYGNGYKNGYLGFDLSGSGEGMKFDYIIIHEAAHEWWGNSLTSFDIADMWIHEGFGQYSECVYLEELYGKESSMKYLLGLRKGIENKEPVIGPYGVNEEGSGDMYPKGAQFLHTLRSIINDDTIWWGIVYGLQTEYKHKNLSTVDVLKYINSKSNLKLDAVFDQYLRYPNIPKLEYSFEEKNEILTLKYKWICDVKDFDMPIDIIVKGEKQRIYPNSELKYINFPKIKSNEVKFDYENFYIN